MIKETIVPCRYKRFCNKPGPGCFSQDEEYCPEAKKLYKKLCPIMITSGYNETTCGCDIAAIRKLWPEDKLCFEGCECLPRKYKEVQGQVDRVTNPESITAVFATA